MAIADPSARYLSAASPVVVVGEGSQAPVVAVLVPAVRPVGELIILGW